MKNFLSTLAMFLIAISISSADIKMEFESYETGNESEKGSNTAIMTKDMLKIDNTSPEGKITMIFNANKNKMIVVNHSAENYVVMNEETLNNIKKQVDGAMAQMKQQFANLPEAQRKQMEKMMEAQMGPMNAPNYTVEKTNETKKINSWNTTKYNMKADGKMSSKIWASSFSELGITQSDFSVMDKFIKFTEKMLESVPKAQKDPFSAIYGVMKGLPVKTVNVDKNQVTELKKVSDYSASKSDFEIPSGYSEQKLGMPSGQR